jgi:hypothetical protein
MKTIFNKILKRVVIIPNPYIFRSLRPYQKSQFNLTSPQHPGNYLTAISLV